MPTPERRIRMDLDLIAAVEATPGADFASKCRDLMREALAARATRRRLDPTSVEDKTRAGEWARSHAAEVKAWKEAHPGAPNRDLFNWISDRIT